MNETIIIFEQRLRAERDAELLSLRAYKKENYVDSVPRRKRRTATREVSRLIHGLSKHVAGWKIDYDRPRDIPSGAYCDVNERLRRWALNHLGAEKKRAYDVARYNAVLLELGYPPPPPDET